MISYKKIAILALAVLLFLSASLATTSLTSVPVAHAVGGLATGAIAQLDASNAGSQTKVTGITNSLSPAKTFNLGVVVTATPPSVGQALTVESHFKFCVLTGTPQACSATATAWAAGAIVIYDTNANGVYDAGDVVVAGAAPLPNFPGFKTDANIKFVDNNANGGWDLGETVVRDVGGTGLFAAADPLIAPSVFGWQFGISYDPTVLVAQADPAVGSLTDYASNTVLLGAVTAGCPTYGGAATLGCSWNSAVSTSSGSLATSFSPGKVVVGFTYLAPHGAVFINTAVVLASVAFEVIKPGTTTATLTVSDLKLVDINANVIPQYTITTTGSDTITIGNAPPTASFTATQIADSNCTSGVPGTCFRFDGSASRDPEDGALAANPAAFFWDFADGTNDLATSGPVVIHDFGLTVGQGTYDVTLRVVDSAGATGSARDASGNVIINAQPSHSDHTIDAFPTANPTTTSVSCAPSSVAFGASTTCTATVTDTSATPTTPTGTVAFTSSGTGTFTTSPCTLAGTGASAICSATFSPTGTIARTDTITATYSGDTGHTTSSGTFSLTVTTGVHSTTTTVSCTPSTVAINQATNCAATVSDTSTTGATAPTGTVNLTPSGSCTLSGTGSSATCSASITPSAAGSLSVTATYVPGTDTTHSASSGTTSVTVTLRTTTSTISCIPTAVAPTQAITCTATITDTSGIGATNPTGPVTFTHTGTGSFDNPVCTLIVGTTCSVGYTPTGVGSHDISASYSGDTLHAASSTATPTTITVTLDPTTIAITCTPSAVAPTQAATCTATVTDTVTGRSPVNPIGTVTFTHTGTGSFDNAQCPLLATPTCSIGYTPTAVGSHDISASYSGDALHAISSTTSPFIITVTLNPTTVTVNCTPSTIAIGVTTSCRATVSDTSTARAIAPTGTITFSPGGPCTLATPTAASASCSVNITPTATGSLLVSATYAPDAAHSGSTGSATVTVGKRTTSTAVACIPSPVIVSTATTCTATVTDSDAGTTITPSGTVTITSSGTGTIVTSPCTLSGTGTTATCSVNYTPSGTPVPRTDTITSAYSGDTNHLTSTNTVNLPVTAVVLHSTTTTVACIPSTIVINEVTTCTATITDTDTGTASTPTGTVAFTPSGTCTLGGTGAVATCTVTISFTTAGAPKVSATYSGDATHDISTNAIGVTVNLRATSTNNTCSATTVVLRQPFTCTATVTDTDVGTTITPTGTVTFPGTSAGSCTLSGTGASATCSINLECDPPSCGVSIVTSTATYAGDATHSGSSGSTSVTVTLRASATTVSCTPSSITTNQQSTCTATVADSSPGTSSTPTGTVSWTASIGGFGTTTSCTLSTSGSCSVAFSSTTSGSATITGSYAGDTTHAISSNTATVAVGNLAPTSTSIVCDQTVVAGQPSLCTATVTDTSATGATSPLGTVTWSLGPATQGTGAFDSSTCSLVAGTAGVSTCSVHFTSQGPGGDIFQIQASYGGSVTHSTSSGSVSFAIPGRSTTATITCSTPVIVNTASTCNVTITDTSPVPAVTPTGSFPLTTSGSGFFGPNCLLAGTGAISACTVNYTPSATGTHTITAQLPIGGTFSYNTAGTFVITADLRPTMSVLTCVDSTLIASQSTMCTATVTDTGPAGSTITPATTVTVTYAIDGHGFSPLQCTLSGTIGSPASASCTVTVTPGGPGQLQVYASYYGDSNHSQSTSNIVTIPITVHATTTTVSCQPAPVSAGSSTTCTATVTDSSGSSTLFTPTGLVDFTSDAGTLGLFTGSPCQLAAGATTGTASCSATYTPTGTTARFDTITASYRGDSFDGVSTNIFSLRVTVAALHPTTTTVVCTPAILPVGQASTCTATVTDTSTVTPTTPTGTVTFTAVGALPGCGPLSGCGILSATSCPLTGGSCFVTFTPSATGSATITGTYGGDSTHATSSGSATVTGMVANVSPAVTFTEDKTTAFRGQMIILTITATGNGGATITQVKVNWSDGTINTLLGTATTDSHSYASLGTFTVTVTVTDSNSLTASATATKLIINQLPTVTFTEDLTTAPTGAPITLNIKAADPDGTVQSITVNWGDNTPIDSLAGTATTDAHTYAKAGSYSVTVTATDNDGGKTTAPTATKTITDRPPIATFTESMTTAPTGTMINFDASGSTDPDGTITTYAWNFGDNNVGTGVTVSHAYTKAGSYTVTLTVTDDSGSTTQTTTTKTIIDRAPTASFTFTPASPTVSQIVTFDGTASNDPDGTITTYAWNFGDTTTGTGATTTHAYTAAGSYTVTLTVTDDAGLTGTTSATVQVTQQVTNPGHAKLIQWRADAKFNPDNLRRNPAQVLRAYGLNDGTVTVNVYVQFSVTNPDGTTNAIYTKVVSLTPGQSINGRLDNRFTASFTTLPGRTNVTATIFYSSSLSTTIGDVSFTPDTASAKTFSFITLGVRTDEINFQDDITSTSQTFDASIQNSANIDLISRIEVTIRQPDGTTTNYSSDNLLLQSGQNGEIRFIVPLTGPDGNYCFTATVKYGIDTNHNGQLDNNEILGTSGRQHECFSADTDDAPAGSVIALPMTITHLSTHLCTDDD